MKAEYENTFLKRLLLYFRNRQLNMEISKLPFWREEWPRWWNRRNLSSSPLLSTSKSKQSTEKAEKSQAVDSSAKQSILARNFHIFKANLKSVDGMVSWQLLPSMGFYYSFIWLHELKRNPKTTAQINFLLQSLHMYMEFQKIIFHITLMSIQLNEVFRI